VNNSTESPATVEEDATVNILATANAGYVFSGWEKTSGEGSFGDASLASTTFTMGTTDATIRANFTEQQTYTVTYHANVTGIADQTVSVDQGANHAVKPANTFANAGYGFTQWTTAQDGTGDAYYQGTSITDIQDDIDLWAQWDEVNYDFRNITGFDGWGGYAAQTVTYSDATVYFESVSHQGTGQPITDQPVTKGSYVTLKLTEQGATMSSAKFYFTQWTNKTQTITLSYSTDGGTTYSGTTPATTSTNFVISNDNLPTGTNAVKITFSSTSNQIGIAGAKITKIASTNPSLAAEDVNLEYDDVDGSISYTLNNPQTGGAVTAAITAGNTGNWLSIGDPSNSNASGTVALTCGVNPGAQRTATVTLTYTYNTKATIEEEVTVTQAVNPNYVPTITEVRAQGTGAVHTQGVVTSVNGKTAYIQDSGAAIAVYDSQNDLTVAVGDQIDVTGTLGTYNGLLQIQSPTISVLSNNNAVTPEVMTIAQVNASTKQGWLVKIEGATVSTINNQNVTIAQSSNSVVVRFNSTSDITFEQNDVITLTGNIGYFNAVQIANPTDITVQHLPAISVNPASLAGFTYVVGNGPSTTKTVSVTGAYLTADITLSLGDNSDFEMSTTEGSGYTNSLTLAQNAGSVAATTIYVRLKAGLSAGDSYSGTITLTSTGASNATVSLSGSVTEPVVDYATLPFIWDNTTVPTGITTENTGGFYSGSPYIKLNQTGTGVVILKLNAAPGIIAFDIKGNPSSGTTSTGTFTVATSADGTNYTTLATYTSIVNKKQTMYFTNLNDETRYIKWSYAKESGNVALGNFDIRSEAIQSTTWTAGDFTPESNQIYVVNNGATLILNGDYSATLNNASNLIIEDGGQLITSNSVQATMKKTITGCTYENTNNAGYRLIASPINGAIYNNTAHTNLTGGAVGYDLYAYDAASKSWLNFKDDGNGLSTLNAGQGYLYANGSDMDLLFMGALNTSIGDKDLPYDTDNTLKSLYLAGNTLSHNETFYVYDDVLEKQTVNFLTINTTGDGFITTSANSFTAKAMQGFFVQSNGTDWTLSTTNLSKSRENNNDKASMLNIMIVNNGDVIDNAIVSFCNAPVLNKFYLNENSTHVYIPKGNEDYAVVLCEGESQMPVNFKAATDGTYTISVETENLDVNYLHLIDNKTGMDVDLLATPSYTFEGKRTDYASRFRLVFDANAGNNETNEEFAFISDGDIVITNNGEATLQVIDMLGRIVSSQTVNGNASIDKMNANGVYVLRLINGNNVKTQKIVVK